MSEIKDLENSEAIEKMTVLVHDIRTCMMCTHLNGIPFDTRPMSTAEVDENGYIWFFNQIDSAKTDAILEDPRMQLLYSHPGKSQYISIYGTAIIIKDRKKTENLWNVFAAGWFQEGKDDPELTLIRFQPEISHYWETKNGKMMYMLRMMFSAITNKTKNNGIEGDLKVDEVMKKRI